MAARTQTSLQGRRHSHTWRRALGTAFDTRSTENEKTVEVNQRSRGLVSNGTTGTPRAELQGKGLDLRRERRPRTHT